jgi:hypothetical protein
MAMAALGALLLAPPPTQAQGFDAQRMRRDLGIAEAVLTHLQGGEELPFANPVRGVYLKEYGAVFLSAGRNRNPLVAMMEAQQGEGEEGRREAPDELAGFKEQTAEFFRAYADAIGQVDEEERITVLSGDLGSGTLRGMDWVGGWGSGRGKKMIKRMFGVQVPPPDSGGPLPPTGKPGSKAEQELFFQVEKELVGPSREPVVFEGSVKKADLRALHRGRLDEGEFARRIAWKEHRPDPEAAKQVDIMAGILDQTLAGEGHSGWGQGLRCSGVYHEGLGAIFFLNLGFGRVFAALAPPRFDRSKPAMPQIQAVAGEQERQIREELVKVVAQYGHTLPLKPGERLLIEVHSGGPQHLSINLMLQVGQEALEAYRKGALSLEEFGQKVELEE